MAKALVVFALCAVAVSAANVVRDRRVQQALEAATAAAAEAGVKADVDDFFPKILATYAKHSGIFKSTDYPRGTNNLYDTAQLQLDDKNAFDTAVRNIALMTQQNKALDISGVTINTAAIISAGYKGLDQLNFANGDYQKAAVPKFEVFKFANGAGVRLMWDDATSALILTPWLAGVRDGLAILRKLNLQPPAGKTVDVYLSRWQQLYKKNGAKVEADNSIPALADAQAWHWSTSGVILTPGSLSKKMNGGIGVPFGVADQVLDAEEKRRAAAKPPLTAMTSAEIYRLRAAYNLIHEFVHVLHALTPAARPLFFETQKSDVNFNTALGVLKGQKYHPAPWLPVSAYSAQFTSPREFVAEIGTKIVAINQRRLPKTALVPAPLKGHAKSNHMVAYRVFGGEAAVPSRWAK